MMKSEDLKAFDLTEENKVLVPDLNATIGYALGLPLNQVVYSPSKRPFVVADKGVPMMDVFA